MRKVIIHIHILHTKYAIIRFITKFKSGTMDIEIARTNMINRQIGTWEGMNPDILNLLSAVPREQFVSADDKDLAFADMSLPIGEGQIMLPPKTQARMLASLQLQPTESVLEVGTGNGFMTALMAKQAKHVYTVDCYPSLTQQAQGHLKTLNIHNVNYYTADAANGFDQIAPVNAIIITGGLPTLPASFYDALLPSGRIMAILGDNPIMEVVIEQSVNQGNFKRTSLFDTWVPMLNYVTQSERFTF